MTIGWHEQAGGEHEPVTLARIFEMDRQQWTVQEVSDPTTADRSLVFSSRGIARRIRRYPEHWRELSDASLADLSWGS